MFERFLSHTHAETNVSVSLGKGACLEPLHSYSTLASPWLCTTECLPAEVSSQDKLWFPTL